MRIIKIKLSFIFVLILHNITLKQITISIHYIEDITRQRYIGKDVLNAWGIEREELETILGVDDGLKDVVGEGRLDELRHSLLEFLFV
jgi:hypothetical protein